jgi:phenylalanyl-tRNA synthetase beta chain
MIFTRSWLNEFIDISNISDDDIAKKMNAIGNEVASVERMEVATGVVLGFVKSCEKHPDADKLSICQVDIGKELVQIVCGAKNVREGLYVAVATLGITLPNGLTMKPVKLRGVDSAGMICSGEEIGLPKLNDGIIEFDDSLGKLEIGKSLSEYAMLNDTIIEVELTANRGDVLSIYGVARELCAGFSLELKKHNYKINDDNAKGIGRVLHVESSDSVTASMIFKVIESKTLNSSFKMDLRLASVDSYVESAIDRVLAYVRHTSGVIVHLYDFNYFLNTNNGKGEIKLTQALGINLLEKNGTPLAKIGMIQFDEAKAKEESGLFILSASYVNPDELSRLVSEKKIKTDGQFYNTSRGSEPNLNTGIKYACEAISASNDALFYNESLRVCNDVGIKQITCSVEGIVAHIGQDVSKNQMVSLLQSLRMTVQATSDQNNIIVTVPEFRHDILNQADITEEIVRLIGIDNIISKPLDMAERDIRTNDYLAYRKERNIRDRAAANGFFQVVHFVFDDATALEKYGFDITAKKEELLNPITAELNTLRSTQLVGLIKAAQRNIYKSHKTVSLFEIGHVFDKNRVESKALSFIFAGAKEQEDILNHAKPDSIDLRTFIGKIKMVLPDCEFAPISAKNGLIHPGLSADVLHKGKVIGFISKLHPAVSDDLDLGEAFIAELDIDAITNELTIAKATSKYQKIQRDFSVMIDKNITFKAIKDSISKLAISELQDIYPADCYYEDAMGEQQSLTIRFTLQSLEGTIEDDRSKTIMSDILETLESSFKATLR